MRERERKRGSRGRVRPGPVPVESTIRLIMLSAHLSRHGHLSFLRPYTNIYRSPFLYARKTRGPCCGDQSQEGPFVCGESSRAFVYEGIKKARRDATSRVETEKKNHLLPIDSIYGVNPAAPLVMNRNFVNRRRVEESDINYIHEESVVRSRVCALSERERERDQGINNISPLTRLHAPRQYL